MTKIGVNACTGRMGQEILYAVDRSSQSELAAALVRSGHQWAGEPVKRQFSEINTNVVLSDDFDASLDDVDVLIDFSLPDYSIATAQRCAEKQTPLVIGTTGFSEQQMTKLKTLGDQVAIVQAPNMSVGVNLTLRLLQLVTRLVGQDSDIEIIESHHRYKKDAPSGTALRMGEIIAEALGHTLPELASYTRAQDSATREKNSIGFSVVRAGNIVGEHTTLFAMEGEEIEITHKARSRQTFAQGAVRAAHWVSDQPPGLYDMFDVLGLSVLDSL